MTLFCALHEVAKDAASVEAITVVAGYAMCGECAGMAMAALAEQGPTMRDILEEAAKGEWV